MSVDVCRPARRTTIRSPSAFHSSTEPGPTPSRRRTSAGTEICPWAVTFECARAMSKYYHGNEPSGCRTRSGRSCLTRYRGGPARHSTPPFSVVNRRRLSVMTRARSASWASTDTRSASSSGNMTRVQLTPSVVRKTAPASPTAQQTVGDGPEIARSVTSGGWKRLVHVAPPSVVRSTAPFTSRHALAAGAGSESDARSRNSAALAVLCGVAAAAGGGAG